jgi:hypothetical protein
LLTEKSSELRAGVAFSFVDLRACVSDRSEARDRHLTDADLVSGEGAALHDRARRGQVRTHERVLAGEVARNHVREDLDVEITIRSERGHCLLVPV